MKYKAYCKKAYLLYRLKSMDWFIFILNIVLYSEYFHTTVNYQLPALSLIIKNKATSALIYTLADNTLI